MERSASTPHSCDLCKDLVLELTKHDVGDHDTVDEHTWQWVHLGEMPYQSTKAELKKKAAAGCDLMLYLIRNFAETADSASRSISITVDRKARYFTMSVWRQRGSASFPIRTFEIYAAAEHHSINGNPASRYLVRPPNPTPASAEGFQRARDWFRECTEDHEECHQWELNHKGFMPTRLLWIRPELEKSVTIIKSSELGEAQPYTALSYCWGGDQACKSTTANLSSAEKIIKDLPLTIQDAIRTTREIGIQYLWVDSMCIIQDNDEDKAREIAKMRKIYSSARVIIAATSASASEEGFLHDRRDVIPRFNLEANFPNGDKGTVTIIAAEPPGFDEPLARRAWAFQECTLAPRILSYGTHQARYFCIQSRPWAVCADGGFTSEEYGREAGFWHVSIAHRGVDRNEAKPGYTFPRLWLSYCEQYSNRDLTLSSDKLIALSAIAEHVAEEKLDGAYYAGLWECNFLGQLCWQTTMETTRARPRHYRAPSWSWASVNGRPSWRDCPNMTKSDPEYACRVEQISVTPTSREAPFAAVSSAFIRVTGSCCDAIWRRSTKELLDVNNRSPVLITSYNWGGPQSTQCYDLIPDATDDFEDDEAHVELLKIHGPNCASIPVNSSYDALKDASLLMLILVLREDGNYSRVGILSTRLDMDHTLFGPLFGLLKEKTLTIV